MRNEELITAADVDFFQDNGYWVSPVLFAEEDRNRWFASMERIYREEYNREMNPSGGWNYREGNPESLRKTDSVHFSDTDLYELATNSTVGQLASRLMGVNVVNLYDTQLLYKPGRPGRKSGANVGWHQDFTYWKSCAIPSLLTAWVAFDDVTIEMGAMQMISGSHKWGLIDNKSDFFEQNIRKQEAEMIGPQGQEIVKVPIVMKAGQVSFHHCYTYHGSGPNSTELPRRSMAIHLLAGENTYNTADHKYDHYPIRLAGMKEGDLYEGEYFPVLFQK